MNPAFDFYAQLVPVADVSDLIDPTLLVAVPAGWSVFVADIQGSTQAVAEGRYKAVNALGAACIIAVSNACERASFPFVFGGDGASFVIPDSHVPQVSEALAALRDQAADALQLTLRVGCVPIGVIRARGGDVLIAKKHLPGGFDMALFAGGGLTLADELVKTDLATYGIAADLTAPLNVEGLECRWNDVPARHGRVMTIIVKPRHAGLAHVAELIGLLQRLMPVTNPVRRENLPIHWPPQHLMTELSLKIKTTLWRRLSYVKILVMTWFYSHILHRQMQSGVGAMARYVESLAVNTDHFKIDDVLRAVLDVNDAQAREVEQALHDLARRGMIFYGLHYSSHAMMTCFVRSLEEHVHFVDGGDGGYVKAAVQLKKSLRAGQQVSGG